MVASSFHDTVLTTSLDFRATPDSVSNLTSLELAVASSRPDLDLLTRQRAYALFTVRRSIYEATADERAPRDAEPLFDADSRIPLVDLSSLALYQLLLVQFAPQATQQLAEDAAALFFSKVKRARTSGPSLAIMKVLWVEVKQQRGSRDADAMTLVVSAGSLRVQQKGETVWGCEASSVEAFKYLAGEEIRRGAESRQECYLQVSTDSYTCYGKIVREPGMAVVALGFLETDDTDFRALRSTMRSWSKEHRFAIEAADVDPSSSLISRSRSAAPDHTHRRSSSPRPMSNGHQRARDNDEPRADRRRSSAGTGTGPSDLGLPPSYARYVSRKRAAVDWNPGFFTRQTALWRAINPRDDIPVPAFTAAEVVFLSFRPDPQSLPQLRFAQPSNFAYASEERLAVEKLYRDRGGYLDRMQTLWLLQSDDHLDLKDYVRALAKIVACRDIYKKAWHDLALHLRGRLSDPSTRDPVETILPIVERLAGTESYRFEIFSELGGIPTSAIKLRREDLGIGPYRRYADTLDECVAFEEKARDKFLTN